MWENILKRSRNKFSTTNLPMLKGMIDRLLDDIPKGTKFTLKDAIDKFSNYLPLDAPIGYSRWWGKEDNVQEGRGPRWFKSYFTRYASNRNKVKTININKQLTEYIKL